MSDTIGKLGRFLDPIVAVPVLAALQPIDKFESGADRQRRLCRESGSWKALIDDITRRLSQELESSNAPAA